ncbi:acyl-CoA thioesterase [Fimbriimonadia bacterium ATM]|nr:MAG: acyl-CoA thioesterase [Armatimonadota bacterium]MBC6970689.1 acyl-CoA thioesterase [Armatimonadota bacterium]MCE7899634.1 acyl-CoA thioesterase [Armatimonadetes bacterium ATM1]MDL1927719.1 acyl-CoA thioesterase [Fimbriimonadia bacterium ATM]RIJ95377.1 MAG: acyl-CoA thioesterase [Armatimonadota bacterium]
MNDSRISDISQDEVRMSELMTPGHANFLGNVFGGAIMSMMDHLAYVTASRYAKRVCVTASFDRVDFHSSIDVGELVHMVGRVVYVGRTSLQVQIEVYAENIQTGTTRHTNTCTTTMVAIDDAGKPVPVPKLECRTREQKINYLKGKMRRELAQRHREESQRLAAELEALTDEELNRKIAEANA